VVQVGRLTAGAQVTTIGVVAATTKLEVQLCVPQASVTVYVKLKLAPVQKALAGRAGMVARLVVPLHPPLKLKPAFHAA